MPTDAIVQIPRLANDLMTKINEESSNGVLYTVQVSYLEIYQEKIRDLLAEDEVEEEFKTTSIPPNFSDLNGINSNEKGRVRGNNPELKFGVCGNNLEERAMHSYTGSLSENSYTSSFLNKAALQRQLEISQRHSKVKSDGEKSSLEKPQYSSGHDGVGSKVRSPKTKPAFDTVFNKQKIHKHYRTFPTVLEEATPVRKQNFLKIREHPITGPFVEGLLWKDVFTWYEMETLMKQGSISRTTAATEMNEQSSRSHAVFSIRLTKKLGPDLFGVHPSSVSYINLVDLAGSEKLPKLCSGAVTGQRTQEESRCINRSLSQLNEVILSLSKSNFVSYRNSVLTWLLKESLGGNSRTFMVANISPTEKDLRESINTLRYATTASRIPPQVALDQDPRNKLIKTLKEEICTLRTLLSSFTSVKENAPSDQLPSLQGFKVPCLDVGLQMMQKHYDPNGSRGKTFQLHLDKESQTESNVRDNGQQTTSRGRSGDGGFQIAMRDGGALDMGNPTVLQDPGRVDIGHQTLILNVCACDSAHQAFAKDFAVMDVGLQVALRELGIVALSQEGTLSSFLVEDVYFSNTRQGCAHLGHPIPSRDFEAVNVGYKIASRDGGFGVGRNQLAMQNPWNQTVLRDGEDIDDRIWDTLQNKDEATLLEMEDFDPANQIKMDNSGKSSGGNQIMSLSWESFDAGNQMVYRESGNVDAGHQVTLRTWGDSHAETHIPPTDWSPIDIGLQTLCSDFESVLGGGQTLARDLHSADAELRNPANFGSKDAGHQTRIKAHGVNNATNCTVVHLAVSHQIDWRQFGASDVGLQATPQKVLLKDAGYQVSWMDFGASDNGEQISWRDFGTSDAGHQTPVNDQGAHKSAHNLNECEFDDELCCYPSAAHDKSSILGPKQTFANAVVNQHDGHRRGITGVGVGHPNVLANLGAIDVSYEFGVRVGTVQERKKQFERKSSNDVRRGQQRNLLMDVSAVHRESLSGAEAVRIGQTSLTVRKWHEKETHSDRKHSVADVGCQSSLQDCCRAIDVELQTNLKTLRTLDVGLQTKLDSVGFEASRLRAGDDNAVTSGCDAHFEGYPSVNVRHQCTSTDLFSLEADRMGLNTYRAVEAWQHFRCRVCGATQDNSAVGVPTTVPIQGIRANGRMQTSSLDFCAAASELHTPITCWGVSPDADQITPKALEVGTEADWEGRHPCQGHHHACWKLLGANDFKHQISCRVSRASRSLSLEDSLRQSGDLGDGQNHWEVCKVRNSGSQNFEEESLAEQLEYQARQEVEKDFVVHNWQHHHEISLSEPSYLVTESDADTLEEASWSTSWASKHQNPQVYLDHVRETEFLQDVKLKQVGPSNVEDLQLCIYCRVVENGVQALPRGCEIVQAKQQSGKGELEGTDHITDEEFDCVSAKTWFLKNTDENVTAGNSQTQTTQESISPPYLSQNIHQQQDQCHVPWEQSRVHGQGVSGQCYEIPPYSSKAEVATQTASGSEKFTDHEIDLSNALQQTCFLWVFIILRLAVPVESSLMGGKRPVGKRSPFLAPATPRKIRLLSYLSDSAIDERRLLSRRDHIPSRLRPVRYSGVESLTFKTTTPFFIQTSGNCSLLRTRVEGTPRKGNTARGRRSYKILCGLPCRRVVHFLKEGVNRLGSNAGTHIFVDGLSEDHTEFVYMPAHRCVEKKGYVVARLVAPEAMAFLNGLPMLEHKELCTGDVLVLRDLRYWSSVCTLHFFDLVKVF